MKYTIEDFLEVLRNIKFIEGYVTDIEMTDDGHGEFPNTYKLTEAGIVKVEKALKELNKYRVGNMVVFDNGGIGPTMGVITKIEGETITLKNIWTGIEMEVTRTFLDTMGG